MEMTGRRALLQAEADEAARADASTHWSRVIEALLRAHYGLHTGHKPRRCERRGHAEHSWMLSGSAQVLSSSPQVDLLLCLSVGASEVAHWRDEMPVHVRAQALHELVVASAKGVDVMVLLGGRDLQVHRVLPNARAARELIAQEEAFWNCVQTQRAPPPDLALDPRHLLRLSVDRIDRAFSALRPSI